MVLWREMAEEGRKGVRKGVLCYVNKDDPAGVQ